MLAKDVAHILRTGNLRINRIFVDARNAGVARQHRACESQCRKRRCCRAVRRIIDNSESAAQNQLALRRLYRLPRDPDPWTERQPIGSPERSSTRAHGQVVWRFWIAIYPKRIVA